MTVADLIAELKKHDPEMEVVVCPESYGGARGEFAPELLVKPSADGSGKQVLEL